MSSDNTDTVETVDDLLLIGERRVFSQAQLRRLSDDATLFARYREILADEFYSTLIFSLVREQYSEAHARDTWNRITRHRHILTDKLGRDPGIAVAAMDYVQNVAGKIAAPVIMDEDKSHQIAAMATRDKLTGLYLRGIFDVSLGNQIEEASRYEDDLALLMLDVDNFKQLNDHYGHQRGDEILQRIGTIINENCRTPDVAARYGGEEFAVILPKTDRDGAYVIAERIRRSCRQQLGATNTTVSIGVAAFDVDNNTDTSLVKAADRALYHAKQAGKNRTCMDTRSNQQGR